MFLKLLIRPASWPLEAQCLFVALLPGPGCAPVCDKPKWLAFLVSNVKGTATGFLGFY